MGNSPSKNSHKGVAAGPWPTKPPTSVTQPAINALIRKMLLVPKMPPFEAQ